MPARFALALSIVALLIAPIDAGAAENLALLRQPGSDVDES